MHSLLRDAWPSSGGAAPGAECRGADMLLSPYLDGEVDSERSAALLRHVETCAACGAKLEQYGQLRQQLRALPAPVLPGDLGLRLRVAASRYSVRGQRWLYWRLRVSDAIRALALPAAVGTAAALCMFTALAGGFRANTGYYPLRPDVGIGGDPTPPRLMSMPDYTVAAPLLVRAQIDATGHVYGYSVLAGQTDARIISQLNNQLLLSAFAPATTNFGQPTTGSVLVSFGMAHVRG
jgi:Putative zinc-finger